ncbi:MAG: hypothetical protein HY593_03695 [Candidatus Omnitrophica bacterium]|nr:hypothetical protein [Candidatus Omnitrophota bacterium]
MRIFVSLCFCLLFVSRAAWGQESAALLESQVKELRQVVMELKGVVEKQQAEIELLKRTEKVRLPEPSPRPSAPAVVSTLGRWNPDIGVLADTVLKLDSPREDAEGADRLSVREVEIVFGSPVDPYSRLDAVLDFSDFEEAALDEAYLTRFELPFDMTARVGRFRPKIGKINAYHRDSLETVDEPLVIDRYFGHEGYSRSGVDLKKLLEVPSPMTHELVFGVLEGGVGEGGTAFPGARRRPTFYSHLKNYVDFSEVTNLEVGLTHLAGSKDADRRLEVQMLGLDAVWMHHFTSRHRLKLQGEAFYMNREESVDGTLWGGYGLVDFRLHPLWAMGFRFDLVELVDNPVTNPHKADTGYTGYLTFYQTEFARWRAQFSHFDLATGKDDNQVLLQGTFAIGEHKHKLQ